MELTENSYRAVTDEVLPFLGLFCLVCSVMLAVLVVFVRMCFRSLHTNSNLILICFMVCLVTTLLTFTFAVEASVMPAWCKVVGGLLHYTYLALFAWLFVHHVHVYRIMTDIRDLDVSGVIWPYHVFAWGFPAMLVVICILLFGDSYGHANFCWFSMWDRVIWALLAPAILLNLFSFYVISMCVYVNVSKHNDILTLKLRQDVIKAMALQLLSVLLFVSCICSINLQLLWLHYVYQVMSLLIALVIFVGFGVGDAEVCRAFERSLHASRQERIEMQMKRGIKEDYPNGTVGLLSEDRSESPLPPPRLDNEEDIKLNDEDKESEDSGLPMACDSLLPNSGEASPQQRLSDPEVTSCRSTLYPHYQYDHCLYADSVKPDLIPSPTVNHGCHPSPYHSSHSSLNGGAGATGQNFATINYRNSPPTSTYSPSAFATFRRPILSPAPSVLGPAGSLQVSPGGVAMTPSGTFGRPGLSTTPGAHHHTLPSQAYAAKYQTALANSSNTPSPCTLPVGVSLPISNSFNAPQHCSLAGKPPIMPPPYSSQNSFNGVSQSRGSSFPAGVMDYSRQSSNSNSCFSTTAGSSSTLMSPVVTSPTPSDETPGSRLAGSNSYSQSATLQSGNRRVVTPAAVITCTPGTISISATVDPPAKFVTSTPKKLKTAHPWLESQPDERNITGKSSRTSSSRNVNGNTTCGYFPGSNSNGENNFKGDESLKDSQSSASGHCYPQPPRHPPSPVSSTASPPSRSPYQPYTPSGYGCRTAVLRNSPSVSSQQHPSNPVGHLYSQVQKGPSTTLSGSATNRPCVPAHPVSKLSQSRSIHANHNFGNPAGNVTQGDCFNPAAGGIVQSASYAGARKNS